jgi:epoxyqueuosine reductase QueG
MPQQRQLEWPRCKCGHLAQDHNRQLRNTDNYGCDICGCPVYRFPDDFPEDKQHALEEQRRRILFELDARR